MAKNLWDKDAISYEDLLDIADMSVEEFKSTYNYYEGWGGEPMKSDEEIQELIDDIAESIEDAEDYGLGWWEDAEKDASEAYEDMYADSLHYLEFGANISDAQKDEAYNASVSDNYATGDVALDGQYMQNHTVDGAIGDDNVAIDWSEMQLMKKTQLRDGEFVRYAPSDYFDDSAMIGETRNICGGTITYLGRESASYSRGEYGHGGFADVDHWAGTEYSDTSWLPFFGGDNRTDRIHYEGVLGSFDYDPNLFRLGYWEAEVEGNMIRVPCLHYVGDGAVENLAGYSYNGFLDGAKIEIPEGLKIADYMFAETGIKSMPELPESLESAHGMFMNCTNLEKGCSDSKVDTGVYQGSLSMPPNLKDTSWMFAGCVNMKDYVGDMGQDLVDARYMYSECQALGWDGKSLDDEGFMETSFQAPNLSRLRYMDSEYVSNMFDGCSVEVIQKLQEADLLADDATGNASVSEWVDDNGVHHNRYDRLLDGSYNPDLEAAIQENSTRAKILKLIDEDATGLTGVSSLTNGLASYGVQITDNGVYGDSTLWANFLQSDFTETFQEDNAFGEFIDRAIPAVGTYAISRRVLGNIFGDGVRGKSIATLGSVAIAAVPQIVGFGNRITPVLDWAANVVGEDNKVGQWFHNLSEKLKGHVTYSTKVEELDIDKTFNEMRENSLEYASDQLSRSLTQVDYKKDGTADDIVATYFDISKGMRDNGKLLAQDANLLFIACEPEENLKLTMSDNIMECTLDALDAKMQNELRAAGSDTNKIDQIRSTYSGYYLTLLYNINEYDDAAKNEISSLYASDPETKAMAMNGLEKVMRNTAMPLYEHMAALQDEWQKKYGMPFMSDKQMNEKEKSTSVMDITGLGTFNDYDPNKDYTEGSDVYADKLAVYQQALTVAVAEAGEDQDKVNQAYAAYYEAAYGWAINEASKHGAYGVVLDMKADLTQESRDSFARIVERVEAGEFDQTGEAGEHGTAVVPVSPDTSGDHGGSAPNTTSDATPADDHDSTTALSGEEYIESITQPDGLKFDAAYYAEQNPDVVEAFGTSDKEVMLAHYLGYGHAEGRAAYNGDAGNQELPADYVTGDAAFDDESDYVKIYQNELAEFSAGYGNMYERVQAREAEHTDTPSSEGPVTNSSSDFSEYWDEVKAATSDLPDNTPESVREYVYKGRQAANANSSQTSTEPVAPNVVADAPDTVKTYIEGAGTSNPLVLGGIHNLSNLKTPSQQRFDQAVTGLGLQDTNLDGEAASLQDDALPTAGAGSLA